MNTPPTKSNETSHKLDNSLTYTNTQCYHINFINEEKKTKAELIKVLFKQNEIDKTAHKINIYEKKKTTTTAIDTTEQGNVNHAQNEKERENT